MLKTSKRELAESWMQLRDSNFGPISGRRYTGFGDGKRCCVAWTFWPLAVGTRRSDATRRMRKVQPNNDRSCYVLVVLSLSTCSSAGWYPKRTSGFTSRSCPTCADSPNRAHRHSMPYYGNTSPPRTSSTWHTPIATPIEIPLAPLSTPRIMPDCEATIGEFMNNVGR